jgi:hypothetical protein
MNAKSPKPADAVQLVRQLDAEAIQHRLAEIDRERSALMVLLRAALRARKQVERRPAREEGRQGG